MVTKDSKDTNMDKDSKVTNMDKASSFINKVRVTSISTKVNSISNRSSNMEIPCFEATGSSIDVNQAIIVL